MACFRPLTGCGLLPVRLARMLQRDLSFRPLTGCGLLPNYAELRGLIKSVSVPLRGVDCYKDLMNTCYYKDSFRPLTGCGLLLDSNPQTVL